MIEFRDLSQSIPEGCANLASSFHARWVRPLSFVARAGLVRFVGFMISAVPVALLSHSYRDVSARFVCLSLIHI